MKKYNNLSKRNIYFILAFFMLGLFAFANFKFEYNFTNAADIQPQISGRSTLVGHNVFIHSPTYSILHQRNVYFFDEYDNALKVYNLGDNPGEGKFNENYLELDLLGAIIDVAYSNDFLYVLSNGESKLMLTQIDLLDFQINTPIILNTESKNYNRISIFETTENCLISLTSSNNDETNQNLNPIVLTFDKTAKSISNYCEIQIEEDEIISTIYKLIIVKTTGITSNDVYLAVIYDGNVGFFGTTFDSLTDNTSLSINSASRSYLGDLDDDDDAQNVSIEISSVNTIDVNGDTYFVIIYTTSGNTKENHSKLFKYSIDVSGSSNNDFSKVLDLPAETISDYTMTSNGCIVSSSKANQSITYVEVFFDTQITYETQLPPITNPKVEVEYKNSVDDFEYVTANKKTALLSTPWEAESNSTCIIDPTIESKDLIVIGYGRILGENVLIGDYKYCLLTLDGKNYKGYVKTEDLTPKEEVSLNNFEYRVFKVQPNTNLYSLPTTVVGDAITPSLTSRIIPDVISENSLVSVEDVICKYKSDEKIMLKVIVNGQKGYIEYDKIIKPSEPVDFVITNASIKADNTKIFESANSSSSIICILDKGYRIRINGSRDTKTGYTSVTFNDEYGNEINGYILTDSLGSDSWTTMQIIGCVLIAINIGLLILILRFKHNSIGSGGSKYIDSENKVSKSQK